nr:HIT domain-containing protein [Gordonia sp. NB41Y]
MTISAEDLDLRAGCVFCEKIHRKDGDLLHDQSRPVVSFTPLNPVTEGHRLFVPTWHCEHPNPNGVAAAVRSATRYVESEQIADYNLITSSGALASQTIAHLHVHLVPRRVDDGLMLPWSMQAIGEFAEIDDLISKLNLISKFNVWPNPLLICPDQSRSWPDPAVT